MSDEIMNRIRHLERLVHYLQDRLAKLENPSAAAWAAQQETPIPPAEWADPHGVAPVFLSRWRTV